MADRRPLSIQESTYFVGSNSFRGGPTSLTKSREEMVFVIVFCQKLLTSRQIFRYAVPARTVTKKHWYKRNSNDY